MVAFSDSWQKSSWLASIELLDVHSDGVGSRISGSLELDPFHENTQVNDIVLDSTFGGSFLHRVLCLSLCVF